MSLYEEEGGNVYLRTIALFEEEVGDVPPATIALN